MAMEHQSTVQPWGTLEELLLACAVNRHGTQCWDSIAVEVQNRTTNLSSLTSQNCIDKFNDLKRRFMPPNDTSSSLVPMVDELRRIRMEELRREVQRHDMSIVSLQLKVKRLEDERESSLREGVDLARETGTSPEMIVGKSAAGNESGDDRSFNESNSTGQQKAERTTVMDRNDTVNGKPDIKPEPAITNEKDPVRAGSDPEAERNWSHNGTLREVDDDENDKIPTNKKEPEIKMSQTTGGLGESNELGESVGESKREDKEEKKQNSDVQSSASLSLKTKKRRLKGIAGGRNGVGVGSSSGEEPEGGDEVSPATKRVPAVKSEPLLKFLGIIWSHRLSSVFERRLQSQESEGYKKLIRQHIDLKMIQCRLDKGAYSACVQKFFRDLLLLFNNAITFFGKNSPESVAASELISIVRKEMTKKLQKPKPEPVTVKPEPRQQPVSFPRSNKSSSTLVVCGKGNSVKATSENATKKVDKKDRGGEDKPKVNEKKIEGSFIKIEEKGIRKKRTKERSVSSHRNSNTTKNDGEIKHQYGGNELSSHDALEMKVERKGSSTRKRQGAASFLKRMKQNSPSKVTDNDEEDDSSEDERKDGNGKGKGKGKEENVRRGRNRDGISERVTRSSRGRGAREESGKAKRIGRPPKKQAESTVESDGPRKRGRDNGGPDVEVGSGRARKRSRR